MERLRGAKANDSLQTGRDGHERARENVENNLEMQYGGKLRGIPGEGSKSKSGGRRMLPGVVVCAEC